MIFHDTFKFCDSDSIGSPFELQFLPIFSDLVNACVFIHTDEYSMHLCIAHFLNERNFSIPILYKGFSDLLINTLASLAAL